MSALPPKADIAPNIELWRFDRPFLDHFPRSRVGHPFAGVNQNDVLNNAVIVPSIGMALTSPQTKPIVVAIPTGVPSKTSPRHRVRPTRAHSINVPRKYLPMALSSRSRSVSDSSK